MKIAEELVRFTKYANRQDMDLTGDDARFKHHKTAKAWTIWLEEAAAFEREMESDRLAKVLG